MTPAEVARTFFEACGKDNWDEAAKFSPVPLTEDVKEYLSGLEIMSSANRSRRNPMAAGLFPTRSASRAARVQKHNLALRNDNSAKRYVFDGGL